MKQKFYFSLISAVTIMMLLLSFKLNTLNINYAMDNIHHISTEWNWWEQDVLKGTYWFEYKENNYMCKISTHECEIQN